MTATVDAATTVDAALGRLSDALARIIGHLTGHVDQAFEILRNRGVL